jgi:hypothetical protein
MQILVHLPLPTGFLHHILHPVTVSCISTTAPVCYQS